MQAIKTAFLGPTATRSARIVASVSKKGTPRVYHEYDHGLTEDQNHTVACDKLRYLLGWTADKGYTPMAGGTYKQDFYWVFINKELLGTEPARQEVYLTSMGPSHFMERR